MNPLLSLYPKNTDKIVMIFTADSGMTKEGELATVRSALNTGVKQVQGCYKGELQTSYVIQTGDPDIVSDVIDLCEDKGQEAILVLDPQRQAYLYYIADECLAPLGRWTETSPAIAMNGDNWTRDGSTFYIVK